MKKLLILLSLFASANLFAEIVMSQVFSDNMLLQREQNVKIWGKSDKNANIEVKFDAQKKSATADKDGKWSIYLDPLKASYEAKKLEVYENGKLGKTIINVLVGEVWISGGQSNMEWAMVNTTGFEDAKKRVAAEKYRNIRYFEQKGRDSGALEPQEDFIKPALWEMCDETVLPHFSAVSFFFAEKMFLELDMPIGILSSSLGGSSMVAWVPENVMKKRRVFLPILESFATEKAKYNYAETLANFKKRSAEYQAQVKAAKAENKPIPEQPRDLRFAPNPLGPGNIRSMPAYLFNAKICPMAGYTARGVIWYQGEANLTTKINRSFTDKFNCLIETWRKAWKNDDMYFLFAQLTSFGKQRYWPETRWEQYQTLKEVKNTGMAVTIDIGEENDIHPRNKTDVGVRMANIALKDVYKKNVTHPYGPMIENVEYNNSSATIKLDTGGRKIVIDGTLRGFEVMEENDVWVESEAKFNADETFTITSKNGKEIKGVRYAWKDWAQPYVCIFNEDKLPAMPFIDFKKN